MASVRRLKKDDPTSPWVCEYTDAAGKRRRITPKTGLKKDAEAARRRIEGELERGDHTASRETKTIAEIGELYERHLEDRQRLGTISRAHLINQRVHLKHTIIPALGARKLADLTIEDVDRMTAKMAADGYARSSISARRGTLGTMEQWAQERGYTKKNVVARAAKSNPITNGERTRVPSKDEAYRIVVAAGQQLGRNDERAIRANQLTVMLGMLCGLRYGEIVGLRRCDIDLGKQVLNVRLQMTNQDEHKPPKTRAGIRSVPCPQALCTLIAEWIERFHIANPGDILITTRGGLRRASSNWQGTWADILKQAGCYDPADPFHFHSARHFAGSLWLEKGIPLAVVSRMLGHSNARVTLGVYTHAIQNEADTADLVQEVASTFLGAVSATQTRQIAVSH